MKENNELTRDDIAIDHDMEVDCDEGREIAVYIETWFDVDKKFRIDTASDDDTWLNMYAATIPSMTPCGSSAKSAVRTAPRILTTSRLRPKHSSSRT